MFIYLVNYIKDATGNVRVLTYNGDVAARYEYDAWGNCNIVYNSEVEHYDGENIQIINNIGTHNPIRWKSQYYDMESGFYYIEGRYYCPEIKQYLSSSSPETMMSMARAINSNSYTVCLTNPVNMVYNGYTIETSIPLAHKPDSTSDWSIFWRDVALWFNSIHWGWKLGIGAAIIAALAVATIATAGIAGVGFGAAFGAGFTGSAIGVGASGLAVTIAANAFASATIGAVIGFGIGGVMGGMLNGTWEGVVNGATGGFMSGAITGAITGGIRGAVAFARSTPLFRTMGPNEAKSISESGGFSPGQGYEDGKFFALSEANARQWGAAFKTNNYVGIRVPKSALGNAMFFPNNLDGIGPAYFFNNTSYLNSVMISLWFI
jgi:RHS repeat-associated protein